MNTEDKHDDEKLDEAIAESFPASDPPANSAATGIRIGTLFPVGQAAVTDNADLHRFELTVDGETAFLTYKRTHGTLRLIHTEVPETLRGRHLGEALVEGALAFARSEGSRIVAVCPFARAYLRRRDAATPSG